MLGHGVGLWNMARGGHAGPSIRWTLADPIDASTEIGTLVGWYTLVGPFEGDPEWALTEDSGGKYNIVAADGDPTRGNVFVAAPLTAGTDPIAGVATGITPAVNPRAANVVVLPVDLPELPEGFGFVVDDEGRYAIDDNEDHLIAELEEA